MDVNDTLSQGKGQQQCRLKRHRLAVWLVNPTWQAAIAAKYTLTVENTIFCQSALSRMTVSLQLDTEVGCSHVCGTTAQTLSTYSHTENFLKRLERYEW